MEIGILITQCLQNDFVKSIEKYDPLPNLMHIGYSEAARLMGINAQDSPVHQVIAWAYELPDEILKIIHIRDWHDPEDRAQQMHLQQFGHHCISNTEGADFVFDHLINPRKMHCLVNSGGLNDFVGTNLENILDGFKQYENVKIGIMGVWTEAKVYFLAYDIATRYPQFRIGVCSALTASSSRAMHFISLEQMQKIIGVQIFSTIGAFTSFLADSTPRITIKEQQSKVQIQSNITLPRVDLQVINYLFRGSREVECKCLDGGFSGNVVLKANGTDCFGHMEVPSVLKIGPREVIGKERMAFERIQEVLGNAAPNIVDYVEMEARGGIKYRYASMMDGKVTTFQDLYEQSPDGSDNILDIVFKKELGRFYAAAELEKIDLLAYYDFQPRYAPHIEKNIRALPGIIMRDDEIEILPGITVANILPFYTPEVLNREAHSGAQHYCSYVHGDLNGKNILIDAQSNVWLIDFFHTHRGHVLRDLIKLENDLLYIFTKIQTEEELREAILLSCLLYTISDLALPPDDAICGRLSSPVLRKAFRTVKKLRSFYPPLVKADRAPYQLHAAIVRYAMHTLGFDESGVLQKKWALYTGALCAALIREAQETDGVLRIDYPDLEAKPGQGVLGITLLPGRKDRGRKLDCDIRVIKEHKITAVVCLVTEQEIIEYGVPGLKAAYRDAGIDAYYFPVLDQTAPDPPSTAYPVFTWISGKLRQGENVLIHCAGGLGRSGMLAAGYLKRECALAPEEAIRRVRNTRGARAIETRKQEEFVFRC